MGTLADRFKSTAVEQALVAALLVDLSALDKIAGKIAPEDFSSQAYAEIYRLILKYAERHGTNIPADYNLLAACSEGRVSISALLDILSAPFSTLMVEDYAREIKRNALRRKAAHKLSEGATILANGGDISDVIKTITELNSLDRGEQRTVKTAQEALADAYMTLYSHAIAEVDTGVYFNLPWLRNKIVLNPGDVCILAARPGDGKSAFVIWQGLRWAKEGRRVLYISLEMSVLQIALRIAANVTEYSTSDYLLKKDESIITKLAEASSSVPDNLEIIDAVNGIDEIVQLVKTRKPEIVILDYLGLIECGRVDDIYQRVSKVSRMIKKLALHEQVVIFAAHQVNRQVASRGSTELFTHDLRDSGAVEQDADAIFFLYPQTEEPTPKPVVRRMYLKLEKNRNGETAKVPLQFHPARMQFVEEAKL